MTKKQKKMLVRIIISFIILAAEKVWRQKVPSKCKSGGKKCRQNSKVTAKSATTQISEKKAMVAESAIKMEKWWRKTPLKQ